MDSVRRKEELLEKYWNGSSTLKEEKELKDLVGEDEASWMGSYFSEFDELKHATIEVDVKDLIKQERPSAIVRSLRSFQRNWSYAAAVAVLIIGFFTLQDQMTTAPEISVHAETYENPDEALEQTEAALAYLMSKMKTGQDKTVNNFKRVEALDIVIPQ